jgi:hypothetical protein
LPENEANDLEHWEDREFIAIRDALIGETEADNYCHTIVRSSFLREFWQDDQVQELVNQWAKKTGLEECVWRLGTAGERLAKLAGLDFRGQLIGQSQLDIAEDQVPEAEEVIAEFNTAFDALMLRLPPSEHADIVGKEAIEFVKYLGLPYPWLAMELIESALRAIVGFALGLTFHVDVWYKPKPLSEMAAPPTTVSFQTEEGESLEDALTRLYDEFESAVERLLEPVTPRGKVPQHTLLVLERNARWFYRHKVKRESIRSIAIHEYGSSDRRKDVYDGIKRAEELLNLTPYTF